MQDNPKGYRRKILELPWYMYIIYKETDIHIHGQLNKSTTCLYVSVKMGNLGYLQIGMDDPSGKLSNQEEKLMAFFMWAKALV